MIQQISPGSLYIRELKARKAKFGFDLGSIGLSNLVPLGKFMASLQTTWPADAYIAEEAGYTRPELKIYTDHTDVADWIRNYNP